jgi:hypothetical protein
MIASTRRAPSFTIASSVDALANRRGEISLTRLSVHCADSSTQMSSVYGSWWTSGIAGCG